MANNTLQGYITALDAGGVRPNMFEVVIDGMPSDIAYLVESAIIPAEQVGTIQMPYRGRVCKIPGDRSVGTWQISVVMADYSMRNAFVKWQNDVQNQGGADGTIKSFQTLTSIFKDLKVHQLRREDHEIMPDASFTLKNAYPTEVGALQLDMSAADQIARFNVTFEYQWHNQDTIN